MINIYSVNIYWASIVVKAVDTMNETQQDPSGAYNVILEVVFL